MFRSYFVGVANLASSSAYTFKNSLVYKFDTSLTVCSMIFTASSRLVVGVCSIIQSWISAIRTCISSCISVLVNLSRFVTRSCLIIIVASL